MKSLAKWLAVFYIWEPVLLKNWYTRGGVFWLAHMGCTGAVGVALVFLAWTAARRSGIERSQRNEVATFLLGVFFAWCVVASTTSSRPLVDVGYSVTFAAMAAAAFYGMPRLLSDWDFDKTLNMLVLPLKVGIAGSLVFPNIDIYSGRFCGVFVSPGAASGALTLACVLLAAQLGTKRGGWKVECALWLCAALGLVLLCRVRGTSLAMLVALAILFRGLAAKRPAAFLAGILALCCVGAFLATNLTRKDFDRGLRYMRLRGDLGTVGRTRWNNWRSAVKEVNEAPIMGKGFSSRWVGESGNLRGGKRGIRYDFTSDPHNVWLTLAKSVGVPGAVLFACFLFGWTRLAWACHRQALIRGARIAVPSLWTALMAWAVVAGLFENVLLSFGAVGDRFAWVALGLLTCPHPAAARPKRPRSRRRKADASRDELGVAP